MIRNLRWPVHLLFGLLLLFNTSTSFSQGSLIKGQVMNEVDQPLSGISITIKGSALGTASDASGRFAIQASAKDVLVFSAIGYKTQQMTATPGKDMQIKLLMDLQGLDEIVVVGYGTQKRSNLTSAVSSVSGEKLSQVAATNPVNALQGRVAGLSVSSPGGNPGQTSDVRLRGIGTFGAHQPLYVIDGVPGDPYYLNSNDVASVEVLKDGAAASIYGSNSANGVILITTKKGKKGAPLIDFSSTYSTVDPIKQYKFLDAEGYKKLHNQMYVNNPDVDPASYPAYLSKNTGVNTDWQDLINRSGVSQNYNLGLSGGSDYLTYALSGDLTDDKGTFIGSNFNKKSFKSRNDFTKGILKVGSNIIYTETVTENAKFNLHDAYFQSPLLPVFDTNEKYGYGLTVDGLPKFENPIGADHYLDADSRTKYLAGSMNINLQLYKGLSYTSNLSYINAQTEDYSHNPPFRANANDPLIAYPKVYNRSSNYKERVMEHLLNYELAINKHNFKLLAGYTAQEKTNRYLSATVDGKTIVRTIVNGKIVETEIPGGFSNPDFNTITAGLGGTFAAEGSNNKYVRLSTLARFNYSYDDKYLFQVSVRRDGSSVFGENRRYGVFPSVSAGWNINKEEFLTDVKWLNNLKLRASYGELGNEGALGFYDHQALITTVNKWSGGYVQGSGATPWPGSASYSLLNRDLRWETIKSKNLGLDFGLFGKVTGSLNIYENVTDGLLITKEVPPSSGLNNPILNVGKIANKGVELEGNYKLTAGAWNIDLGGSFSLLKNEVLSLANADQVLYGSGLRFGTDHTPTQTKVGKEIGAFYLYETAGIFQSDAEAANYKNADGDRLQPNAKAGDIRFRDVTGDGIIDEEDKSYQGSGFAKFEYGLNMAANFKNFDVSLFWQGIGGNKIYNGNRFELEGMEAGRNFLATTLNAWTPQNTNTDMPRAVLGDENGNARESTRFLENGAYLRLKVIQLGYTFPESVLKNVKVSRLRVYLSGQNLLTLTKYTGLDPEVGNFNALDTGIDRMLYPQNKRFMAGLQLTF
ncbi:SusC/RagA family TonB-linked outer membrane protein [Pedobacter arcticus]|uniref:SusC/RagA family TonB-linked outer membrane protein n=1 Tax=Pedobacter arcticus TaxID=752140 RepID=UPI0009FE0251|nr:TonB-dependent receptor [Pedobacter arcticus]